MENVKEIIAIISAAITILVTVIPLLIALIKKTIQLTKQKDWMTLLNQMKDLAIYAETAVTTGGEDKKQFVLEKLKGYALTNKIAFDEELLTNSLENLIALSKKLNNKKIEMIDK